MYCTKCGKEIESGIICKDCLEREVAQNPDAEAMLKAEVNRVFTSEPEPATVTASEFEAEVDTVPEAEVLPAMDLDTEPEVEIEVYAEAEPEVTEVVNDANEAESKEILDLDEIIWQPGCESLPFSVPVGNTDKMLGFGRALASIILGTIGYIFAFVSYMLAYIGDEIVEGDPELALVMLIVALGLNVIVALPVSIISLVNGVKSIKLFKKTVGKKPVAALVLGIIGTYSSACALLMLLTSLLYI